VETARAYRSDWGRWEALVRGPRHLPRPADPALVACTSPITPHSSGTTGSPRTRRPPSAGGSPRSAPCPAPPASPRRGTTRTWRAVLAGVRRDRAGTAQRKRDPLMPDGLAAVCARAAATAAGWYERLAARRDTAVLCACWAGALRRSEPGTIAAGDIAYHRQDGLHVLLRKSGGDREGQGLVKALPFGESPVTCPVCAVLRWAEAVRAWDEEGRAGIMRLLAEPDEPGHACRPGQPLAATAGSILSGRQPLFRAIHRAGLLRGPLSGHAVSDIVARRAGDAGFVTQALRAGAPAEGIARQPGHAQLDTVPGYRRDRFADWCAANRVASLPAAPATVLAYLEAEQPGGRTAARRAAAIRAAHEAAGLPDPCGGPAAAWVRRRRSGAAAAEGEGNEQLGRLAGRLPAAGWPGGLPGRRDRLAFLLSELGSIPAVRLVGLPAAAVTVTGPGSVQVKHDGRGDGRPRPARRRAAGVPGLRGAAVGVGAAPVRRLRPQADRRRPGRRGPGAGSPLRAARRGSGGVA